MQGCPCMYQRQIRYATRGKAARADPTGFRHVRAGWRVWRTLTARCRRRFGWSSLLISSNPSTDYHGRVMRFSCLLPLLLLCAAALQPQSNRPLEGVIDVHVHSLPDSEPWTMDGIEVAKLAKSKGMRGVVLKSHWEPTATLAYLARKEVPGLGVLGGICFS